MKRQKHIVIYNCMDKRISQEIIATDTIKHIWLELPERKRVVIEYINPSTEREMSVSEYYTDSLKAESRIHRLAQMICGEGYMYGVYSPPITEDEAESEGKE